MVRSFYFLFFNKLFVEYFFHFFWAIFRLMAYYVIKLATTVHSLPFLVLIMTKTTTFWQNNDILTSSTPNVVWSANPKNPVSYNATLHLTSDRGLVLQDVDGTIAWSTNISSNKYVAGLRLTDTCNLQLLDENNATIWQSFDHPIDTLVIGPKFGAGAATY